MKWQGRAGSQNIEDRRGMRMGLPIGGGIGGLVLILLFSALTGQDPTDLLNRAARPRAPGRPARHRMTRRWSSFRWFFATRKTRGTRSFRKAAAISGSRAGVVHRCDAVGMWRRSVGDGSVRLPARPEAILDLSFFRELDERFGAPGDFAQAYVVAHEVGHHVQTLTGISDRVASAREQGGRSRQMRCRFVRSSRRTAMRACGGITRHNMDC